MKRALLLAACLVIVSCAADPVPTPPTSPVPTESISTVVPIPTLLPTVTIPLPTPVPVTPTATVAPPAAVVAVPTRPPAARFPAPTLLEPNASAVFKDGNDIKFVYGASGRLEPNQCYLLHIEFAVPNLERGNRGDDFLDVENCGDPGPAGKELTFVLYRGKFTNSPNYGTILNQTHELLPEARLLKMTWTVRVVQNNGRATDGVHYNTVDLSPSSPRIEFDFQP